MSKKNNGSSAKKGNKKVAQSVKKSPAKKVVAKKSAKPANAKPSAGKSAKTKVVAPKGHASKALSKQVKVTKKVIKPLKTKTKAVIKKIALPPTKSAVKKAIVKAKPLKVEKIKAHSKAHHKPVSAKTTSKPVKHEVTKKAEPKFANKKNGSINTSFRKESISQKFDEKEVETSNKKQSDVKPVSNEVLAISNTIPKPKVSVISASKIASISSSITNPIKKVDSYSIKSEKEPNGKYEMEIVVRSSPEMLYEFLSTPSGLSEWFCDDVNIRNGIFTFIWEGQLQQARLLKTVDDHLVRFQWVDKIDGSYFEFKIQRDDLTNDISLIVTDFAETVLERESSKLLWQSQVEKLLHIMGSI